MKTRPRAKRNENGVNFEDLTPAQKYSGRKTGYRPELCLELITYFSIRPWYEDRFGRKITNDFPSIAGFCASLCISKQCFHEWVSHYDEFREAYQVAKCLQENFWLVNSCRGKIPSNFAIFLGQNYLEMKNSKEITIKKSSKSELEKMDKESLKQKFLDITRKNNG